MKDPVWGCSHHCGDKGRWLPRLVMWLPQEMHKRQQPDPQTVL